MLRSRPEIAEKVVQSLAAVHQLGVLHGDVQLHKFVVAPDDTTVWLLDLKNSSCRGEPYELEWEREYLLDLLDLQPGRQGEGQGEGAEQSLRWTEPPLSWAGKDLTQIYRY